MLPGLWGASVAAAPPAGHLWSAGEDLGGAVVEDTVLHAEFERATLRLADGSALQVELLPASRVSGPACAAHGLALAPRWELRGETVAVEDQPAYIQALCQRLNDRGPTAAPLALSPNPAANRPKTVQTEGAPPQPTSVPPLWLRAGAVGALIGLLLGGASMLRGARVPALLALAAGAVAVRLSHQGVLIGPDAGAISLAQAATGDCTERLYGPAWPVLAHALTGGDPRLVFAMNQSFAALFPALLVLMLRALLPALRPAALAWAGAAAAFCPALLRVAGSEIPHIALLCTETLALGALGAALRARTPRGPAAALALAGGCLAGLAPALRPEGLPFAALPLGALLLADRARRAPLVVATVTAALLALPRLAALFEGGPATGVATPSAFRAALDTPWPLFATQTPVWPALALLGVRAALRGDAGARLAVLALTLSLGPTLHKFWPMADLWRLQLPSLSPALALAATGAAALAGLASARGAGPGLRWALRAGGPGSFGVAAILISGLPGVPRVLGRWAPREDWTALTTAVEGLPAGATLLIAGDTPHSAEQATALVAIAARVHADSAHAGPVLRIAASERAEAAQSRPDDAPIYAYEGLRCAVGYPVVPQGVGPVNPCDQLRSRCRIEPVWERSTPPIGDIDLRWPQHAIPLRLLRVYDCAPGAGWGPGPG